MRDIDARDSAESVTGIEPRNENMKTRKEQTLVVPCLRQVRNVFWWLNPVKLCSLYKIL